MAGFILRGRRHFQRRQRRPASNANLAVGERGIPFENQRFTR
jgi:hypothetical protein